MHGGNAAGLSARHLFGERIISVVGAQAGFHMTHRNLVVKRGQGGGHHRHRVALHKEHIGSVPGEKVVHTQNDPAGKLSQSLPMLHQVQVIVSLDIKPLHHLVQHLPVLGGDGYYRFKFRRLFQGVYDRRQLDSLGARPEHTHDPLFHKLLQR